MATPLPPDRKRNRAGSERRRKNGHPRPEFDLRTEAYKLFGLDVSQIPGKGRPSWVVGSNLYGWRNRCRLADTPLPEAKACRIPNKR